MKRLYWLTLILALILTLGGCSTRQPGGYYKDDGPHKKVPVNIDAIQDAVPRHESLSKSGNKPYTVFGKRQNLFSTEVSARLSRQGCGLLVWQKIPWEQDIQWRNLQYVCHERSP